MLGELGELGESILATFLLGHLLWAVMKGCDEYGICSILMRWVYTKHFAVTDGFHGFMHPWIVYISKATEPGDDMVKLL